MQYGGAILLNSGTGGSVNEAEKPEILRRVVTSELNY